MAKFDVYRIEAGGRGYLLDIQSDFLSYLGTRVVIPLLMTDEAPPTAKGLNPIFKVGTDEVIMATHLMAAVPRSALQSYAGNLSDHWDVIVGAIDFLLQGV